MNVVNAHPPALGLGIGCTDRGLRETPAYSSEGQSH